MGSPYTAANTGITKSTAQFSTEPTTLGMFQASGASAVGTHYCGEWMVETQRLDLTYERAPRFHFQSNSTSASLSGVQMYHVVQSTRLDTNVVASYKREKVDGCFTTSGSFTIPQTFQINAVSADHNGLIYGPDSEWNTSCLGPMGSINTLTEWYFRRPWEAGDTTASYSINGFNMFGSVSSCSENHAINIDPWFGDFIRTPWPAYQGSPLRGNQGTDAGDPNVGISYQFSYYINGPYSYLKENNNKLITYIQQSGDAVTNSDVYDNPAQMGQTHPNNPEIPLPSLGFSEYSSNRHLYLF